MPPPGRPPIAEDQVSADPVPTAGRNDGGVSGVPEVGTPFHGK
jgi:hypothetical protein